MAAQYLTDRAIDEHMEEAALRAQEIAAAEARERAAEAARRRIEQERRKQLAEEAAKRAACPGYNAEFVALLTEEEQAEAEYFYEQGYVFFRQNWSVTKDAYYGNEGFGQCGCGPTCVAAIISNLAGIPVTPEDMRLYGLEHGSWLADAGTTYDFMITTPTKYGIKATQIYASDKEALYEALVSGHLSAAACDTLSVEPVPADHPLLKLDQVIITSHIGMYSYEAINAVSQICADNAAALLGGGPLRFTV